jgi:hypothetical protein
VKEELEAKAFTAANANLFRDNRNEWFSLDSDSPLTPRHRNSKEPGCTGFDASLYQKRLS